MSRIANEHKMYQRVHTTIPAYDIFFNNTCGVKPIATSYKELATHIGELGTMQNVNSVLYDIISTYRNNRNDRKMMDLLMKNVAQKAHGEVFTPSSLVEEILDEFEIRYPDFFKNPNYTVLDFAAGSGNLLKEVINRFFKGTRHLYNDDKECMRHILMHQIYAIEYQPNNYKMLCVNLDYENLVPNNPHFVCADANGFDYWDMMYNFDMVFINPPYAFFTKGDKGTKQVYPFFSELAKNISARFVINIIPSKFLYTKNDFRTELLSSNNVVYMKTFFDSRLCFPNSATIAGGILYYILDKRYNNKGKISTTEMYSIDNSMTDIRDVSDVDVYPRTFMSCNIINKVTSKSNKFFKDVVRSNDIFKIQNDFKSPYQKDDSTYEVICASNRLAYIKKDDVKHNTDVIDKYKFVISYATNEYGLQSKDGKYKIISNPQIVDKNVLFTQSLLCIDVSDDIQYLKNIQKFFEGKFSRYLLLIGLANQHISKNRFCFVPYMDFSKSWSDEELYKFFELNDDEIKDIESSMK